MRWNIQVLKVRWTELDASIGWYEDEVLLKVLSENVLHVVQHKPNVFNHPQRHYFLNIECRVISPFNTSESTMLVGSRTI